MGTRAISDKMSSGELASIKVGGATADEEVVLTGANNTALGLKADTTAVTAALALKENVADALTKTRVTRAMCGFDREDTTTMGIIQYCHLASSGEIHQIDEDGVYSLLTAQTLFADGVTALADRTLAQYHSAAETQFSFWYQGTLHEITDLKTIEIPDDSLGNYVHYDSFGVLQVATSLHDMIVDHTLLAEIYNNATTGQHVYFADERHGIVMDGQTHLNIHSQRGFGWVSGLDITGLVNNGTTFTEVEAGKAGDEDIPMEFATITTAPFVHRTGTDGAWALEPATNKLAHFVGAKAVYNEWTGTTWQLTEIDADYVIMTFFATNNKQHPVVRVIGQTLHPDRTTARNHLCSNIAELSMNGMPSPEMMPLGSMIIHVEAAGQIEVGSDSEIWVDCRRQFPISRY